MLVYLVLGLVPKFDLPHCTVVSYWGSPIHLPVTPAWPVTSETGPLPLEKCSSTTEGQADKRKGAQRGHFLLLKR